MLQWSVQWLNDGSSILNRAGVQWLCQVTPERGYTKIAQESNLSPWKFSRQLGHLSSWVCKNCCLVTSLTRHRINRWRTITRIRSRPHVSAVFVWKGRFITGLAAPTVHTYPVKRITENASFQEHSTKRRSLKKRAFSFNCGRQKREVFEHHKCFYHYACSLKMLSYFHFFSDFFWWTGDWRKRFECGMCGPSFIDNGEKISLFQKYQDTAACKESRGR